MSSRSIIGMTLLLGLALPAAAQVANTPQSAGQPGTVKFVGQSRATVQLKSDVMVAISGYTKARHSCGTITTVETAPMKPGFEPRTAMFRVSEPDHLYERWIAEACGTKRAFLVALWPSPKGGADYKVVEVPPGTEP
jgi:hypothetical protein